MFPCGKCSYRHQENPAVALQDYALEILGSKAKISLLKALVRHRGKAFTVRELAKASGLSHPEVSKIVKELANRNLVKVQSIGRAYSVELNAESYAYKSIVEPLFVAERDTLRSLVSTIRPFFSDRRILSAAIFGSVARGSDSKTSDVDILLITKDKEFAHECLARASVKTISRFGLALSPTILDGERFRGMREGGLAQSILESYLLVGGKDLKEALENDKSH